VNNTETKNGSIMK